MKYYWHIHHDELVESSENIAERIVNIKNNKPAGEIEIRLRLLKEVQGQLPQGWRDADKAWRDADKALRDADKAWRDADKAWKAWRDTDKAWRDADKAWKAWRDADKAWRDADKALRDADKEWRDADKAYKQEIEALHAIECPGCPWDGHTIFTEKEKEGK